MSITNGTLVSVPSVVGFRIRDGITHSEDSPFAVGYDYSITSGDQIKLSLDKKWIIASAEGSSGYIMAIDVTTTPWSVTTSLTPLTGAVKAIAVGSTLVAIKTSKEFVVIELGTWNILYTESLTANVVADVSISNDESKIIWCQALSGGDLIVWYDTATYTNTVTTSSFIYSRLRSIAINSDGTKAMLALSGSPYLSEYTLASDTWSNIANISDGTYKVRYNPNYTRYAVAYNSTTKGVGIFDATTHTHNNVVSQRSDSTSKATIILLSWLNNDHVIASASGNSVPTSFNIDCVALTSAPEWTAPSPRGLCVVPDDGNPFKVECTIDENLTASEFTATAYDTITGAIVGRTKTNLPSFTIGLNSDRPVKVTVEMTPFPRWKASHANVFGDLVYPTSPSTIPYYYKCIQTGTTSSSEPTWSTVSGGTTNDGTVIWELVERLVQPVTHTPLIPVPV